MYKMKKKKKEEWWVGENRRNASGLPLKSGRNGSTDPVDGSHAFNLMR